MTRLCYIGTGECEIGAPVSVKLTRIGQRFEVPDDQLSQVMGDGGVLAIADAVFSSIGFTDEELANYGAPAGFATAPPTFKEKWKQAMALRSAIEEV